MADSYAHHVGRGVGALDCDAHCVHYLRRPFQRELDFGVTSVNYDLSELIVRAEVPC
jgi:hypothetical protein